MPQQWRQHKQSTPQPPHMAMMTASGRAAKGNDSARLPQEPGIRMGMAEADPDLQPHRGSHPSRGSEDCMRGDGAATTAAVSTSATSATSSTSAAVPHSLRRTLMLEIVANMAAAAATAASSTADSCTASASASSAVPSPLPSSSPPSSPFAAYAATGTRFSEDSAAPPPRLLSVNSMLRHDILDSNFNSPTASGSLDGASAPTAKTSSSRRTNTRGGRRYEVAGEQSWWSIFGMEIKRDSEG